MSVLDDITEFERLWEKIKGHLVTQEFKTPIPQSPPKEARPVNATNEEEYEEETPGYAPVGQPPTPIQITDTGVEFAALDYLEYGKVLKPKKFLGDKWSDFNTKLIALNYT